MSVFTYHGQTGNRFTGNYFEFRPKLKRLYRASDLT